MNTTSCLRLRATDGYRAIENFTTLESLLCDNVEAIASLQTTFMSFDEDEDFEEEDEEEFDDEYDGSDEEDFDEAEEEEDYDEEEEYEDEDEEEDYDEAE